ncbi:Hypothetical predicted protein, partial [Paramuricea clavata]
KEDTDFLTTSFSIRRNMNVEQANMSLLKTLRTIYTDVFETPITLIKCMAKYHPHLN